MIYETILNDLSDHLQKSWKSYGMLVLEVEPEQLLELVQQLKKKYGFDLLLDVTAVDYPDRMLRFELVYHFYSFLHHQRLRLKVAVTEGESQVPTLTELYGSAGYLEREVYEMYGISFAGNKDLRPILLYEGFDGHPLRKDYPIDREQPLVPYRKKGETSGL